MASRKESDGELEPLDPKAASRAIGRHIKKKKTAQIRRPAPEGDGGAEPSRAKPAPPGPPKTPADPPPAPPVGPSSPEKALKALALRDRELVSLMEHSVISLMEAWCRAQTGETPETAIPVSKTEVEFLLLRRSLME